MTKKTIRFATAFVVVFAFFSLASESFGQKIYLLAAGDVQAPIIGKSVQVDVRNVIETLWSAATDNLVVYRDVEQESPVVPAAPTAPETSHKPTPLSSSDSPSKTLILHTAFVSQELEVTFGSEPELPSWSDQELPYWSNPELPSWSGPNISESIDKKRDLLQALADCPAEANDVIVCYWSGHGAFDEKGHYLAFQNEAPIYRQEILQAMKKKGARFVALITDSCNKYHSTDVFNFQEFEHALPPVPKDGTDILQILFLNCRGALDVNASSPGEEAIGYERIGGVFTDAALTIMQENYDPLLTWEKIAKKIDERVARRYQAANQKVYVWEYPTIENRTKWSPARYRPENGDRIIAVNNQKIDDEFDFRAAVAKSPTEILLTLIDRRTENRYYLKTKLRPKRSKTRLGIYVGDPNDPNHDYHERHFNGDGDLVVTIVNRGGVAVTDVETNSPGARCQYLQTDAENATPR